jgi:hypothetical protein
LRRDRYAALPGGVGVFRTARVGGEFLPEGHLLPKPEWLEPTKDDQEEAKRSGRPPGLSVWEVPGATHAAACWIRRQDELQQRSFTAGVDKLMAVAAAHTRQLDIVADPLEHPVSDDRWSGLSSDAQADVLGASDAHSLIEGIKRRAGLPEREHRSFREEFARSFAPLAEDT